MKNAIQISAKLYECRDTAKKFFKEKYPGRVDPYIHLIKQVMKANNTDEIQSLLMISKTNAYLENGMGQMMFMAAVVELIEPSTL